MREQINLHCYFYFFIFRFQQIHCPTFTDHLSPDPLDQNDKGNDYDRKFHTHTQKTKVILCVFYFMTDGSPRSHHIIQQYVENQGGIPW